MMEDIIGGLISIFAPLAGKFAIALIVIFAIGLAVDIVFFKIRNRKKKEKNNETAP